jgi:anti-anti-sigma factor
MEIKSRKKDSVIILDLYGRIDVNSANLVEVVGQCVHEGFTDILCNFESVDFIDYMGISAIIIAYKEIVNNNGRMKFTNIPAHLKGIFSITGLDRTIDMYATEDLAVDSFREDQIIENIKRLQLRRRFKRLEFDIKIELKDRYDKSAVSHKGDILNLSAVGAYIYGCDKFKLQDELLLRLKIPPEPRELEISAKVVWLSDKQIQPQFHPGMGVEFLRVSNQTQQKLLGFIERNLSLSSTDN